MIIVTGGAGFIGSNIVAALEARGETEVVVCDSLGDGDKWRNIAKRDLMGILPPESLVWNEVEAVAQRVFGGFGSAIASRARFGTTSIRWGSGRSRRRCWPRARRKALAIFWCRVG